MNANIGSLDRIIRIVIGVALLGWAATGNKLGYLGVIPLATAFAGWCPLYVPLKLSTRKR